MRVLFLPHEQYGDFENESGNQEIRRPMLECGLVSAHRDLIYQRILRADGPAALVAAVQQAVLDFRPDLVVNIATWPHENVPPACIAAIDRNGAPVLTVLADTTPGPLPADWHDFRLFHASRYVLDSGSFFGYARFRMWSELMRLGKGVLLLCGNNVHESRYPPPRRVEKDIDVAMIGSVYVYRKQVMEALNRELARDGIEVRQFGGHFDESKASIFAGGSDTRIDNADYAALIDRTKVLLCIGSSPGAWTIRGKIYEYLHQGALCLAETNPDIENAIPPGTIPTFSTIQEAAALIRRLVRDDAEREHFAAAGAQWYRETYDCKRFWRETLTAIANGATEFRNADFVESNYLRLRDAFVAALAGETPADRHFERMRVEAEGGRSAPRLP